jgi:predicted flap endonuclease-1-like 5' DNA nuclease
MQELVSFVAILVGVIVLTAWVMWLLLRTSGQTRAMQFARESAREGLTAAAMENNQLKNRVAQLERQLKVCMGAGYGKTPTRENSPDAGLTEEDWKELEKLTAEREAHAAKKAVEANEAEEHKKKDHEPLTAEAVQAPVADTDKTETQAQEKPSTQQAQQEAPARPVPQPVIRPRTSAEEVRKKIQALKAREQEQAAAQQPAIEAEKKTEPGPVKEPAAIPGAEAVTDTTSGVTSGLVAPAGQEAAKSPDDEIAKTQEIDYPERNVVKPWENDGQEKDETEIARTRVIDYPAEADANDDEPEPPSLGEKIQDEAERKKIDDFLARIAEKSESQKKSIQSLNSDESDESDEESHQYPDDSLRKIKGIGPHLEHQLKKIGITSYQQIAEFDDDQIRRVSEQIGSFPRRIKREGWVEQARKLLGKG